MKNHKHEHYFSAEPSSRLRMLKIETELLGRRLRLYSGSSVFSKSGIDLGTRTLIENACIKPGWLVLDLGCGYGAVGIAIAKAHPSCRVVMTDINRRAVMLAKMNAKENNVNAGVFCGDGFEPVKNLRFNTILLNPPQTAGKRLCEGMILASKDHLKRGGLLQLVARHRKGGRSLAEVMLKCFGNLSIAGKGAGYRVYVSENLEHTRLRL